MKRSIFSKKFVLLVVFVSLFLVTGVLAAGEAIQRFAVVSGGSVEAEAGGYQLSGALGQPVAGSVRTEDDSLRLCSGFWCGGTLSNLPYNSGNIYLPLILRNWPPVENIGEAPNTCSEAYKIEVDKSYREDIDGNDDIDFLYFTAESGITYTIEIDNMNLNLYLLTSTCSEEVKRDVDGQRKIVWINSQGAGDYRIVVQPNVNNSAGEVYILGVKKTP